MKKLLIIAAVVGFLGLVESFLGAPEVYGADLDITTAGQTSADTHPYYKGAKS